MSTSNSSSILVVSSSSSSATTPSNTATSLSASSKSRFPRMQECAHFHYEVNTVEMPKNFRALMLANGENEVSSITTNNEPPNKMMIHPPYYNNSTGSLVNPSSSSDSASSSTSSSNNNIWFQIQITAQEKKWIIYRTYENFRYLDKYLHDCIFDRKFSCLEELVATLPPTTTSDHHHHSDHTTTVNNNSTLLPATTTPTSTLRRHHKHSQQQQQHNSELVKQLRHSLGLYLTRFCEIAFINPINCGPILNWFELDNRGNRLLAIDDSPINIPGVAAAVVKKRYVSQALDELSLEVGNMISVIDMPPADESIWWRGKKELEVGFFPSECVELIRSANYSNNSPAGGGHHQQHQASSSNSTSQANGAANGSNSPTHHHDHFTRSISNQSVRLKHGKLITLLRSFFNTRPARIQLQSKGILRQRVFGCDLGEHLSNIQQEVPKLLTICTEFIEKNGTVDGIYRHTGLQSNIQRLRNAFDEERFDEIQNEIYVNDVHSVSSLLKMYFRELPNPLLTYQLYNKFIRAVNVDDKIIEIHDVVQQLPPPHYRTLAYLMKHLHQLAKYSTETNMNTKNLAIVWAPNLLKSKEMDSKDCMQYDMLHSITLQANITEFLIANADTIFNDKFASLVRKHDLKNNIAKNYRPISICYNAGGTKLLSLEEAQDKYKQVGPADLPKYHTVIDLPDVKKKKSKECKDPSSSKSSKSSSVGQNTVPANIQIQQQFESLQQQQQQQSNQTVQTTPTTTTSSSILIPQAQTTSTHSMCIPNNNNNNCASSSVSPPSGNSGSPAFKSLFRNLRVGSLKHPSPSSSSSIISPSPPSITNAQQLIEELKQHNSQSMLTRTSSTFKPPPPLPPSCGLSTTTTAGDQMKADYSNCITQLQSAAAQAVATSHETTTTTSSNTAPTILVRTSRLNHSQTSIKYSPSSKMTTFKETTLPTTASPLVEDRKLDTNPVPSKRRTIQPQYQLPSSTNINNSSSSGGGSFPTSNSSTHLSTFCKTTTTPVNNSHNQHHHHEPVSSTNSSTDSKEVSSSLSSSSGTTQPTPHQQQHQVAKTEDEMQQIVEYMNRFEAETIQNAPSNNNYDEDDDDFEKRVNDPTSTTITNTTEVVDNSKSMISSESQNSTGNKVDVMVTLIPSNEMNNQTEKLRLSSSSLSSSVDSCLDRTNKETTNFDQVEEESHHLNHHHHRQTSVDRRTYIISRTDQLDNENNRREVNEENDQEEDEYEKVILNTSGGLTCNHQSLSATVSDSTTTTDDNVHNHQRGHQRSTEPIYVNLRRDVEPEKHQEEEEKENMMIGESTVANDLVLTSGDDVETKQPTSSNNPIEFNSELIEINQQIRDLLTTSEDLIIDESSKVVLNEIVDNKNVQLPTQVVSSTTPSSSSSSSSVLRKEPTDVVVKRPKSATTSSITNGVNNSSSSSSLIKRRTINPTDSSETPVAIHHHQNSVCIVPKSVSNDEILRSSTSTTTSTTNDEKIVTPKKRRSENSTMINEPDRTVNDELVIESQIVAKTSLNNSNKPLVVPKTRQSLSTRQSSSNTQSSSTQNHTSPPSSSNSLRVCLQQKSMSKSLQDNSRFGDQTHHKLVLIETTQQQQQQQRILPTDDDNNNQDDDKSAGDSKNKSSVKSKIKLMESIVGTTSLSTNQPPALTTTLNNNNKRQNSSSYSKTTERSSSTSSSTSSSYSSSRSPPVSPKIRTLVNTTSPPFSSQLEEKTNEDEKINMTESSISRDVTPLAATGSNNKRKTVKELLSQFEKS